MLLRTMQATMTFLKKNLKRRLIDATLYEIKHKIWFFVQFILLISWFRSLLKSLNQRF